MKLTLYIITTVNAHSRFTNIDVTRFFNKSDKRFYIYHTFTSHRHIILYMQMNIFFRIINIFFRIPSNEPRKHTCITFGQENHVILNTLTDCNQP